MVRTILKCMFYMHLMNSIGKHRLTVEDINLAYPHESAHDE
jgi:hypothetical protein